MKSQIGSAVFDDTKLYRYQLTRSWGSLENKGIVTWVMLNPSTADEFQNDPTIRRCISFSKQWGYSGLIITNIFAFRSTDPKGLYTINDPMGVENPKYIQQSIQESSFVVAAWGAFMSVPEPVRDILKQSEIYCLGTTKTGQPKHPLYVKGDTIPVRFQL